MYRQPSEHAYSRPPQHQGAMMAHDEYSQASQTFYPQYPQQSAYSRAAPQPDPSYYQPQHPPARQASIYGPPLAQAQQPQQMHSQRPIRSRPIPASQFKEDPAFSPDPRSNPLAGFTNFTMNSKEEIVPAAGTQGHNTPPNAHGSASKRDPSAIYAYPPAPPVPPASATSQYPPPSLQPFPSAGSHHSRPPSDGDSFYTRSSFASSAPSHNGSHARDPRGSNDASSVRLAYDDVDERVIPPEPSSAARQSYYSKYDDAESDAPRRPEEQSSRKLHKARHEDKNQRQMSQASLASSANTSYSSSKSSSASSFARAQSGGVSIASSKSKSSLRVVNPDPYAIFTPAQHSPDSSASSIISSSEGPHTPSSAHGHFDPNSPFPSSEKGYIDDKRLRREKSKEAAMAHDGEHDHEHGHEHGHPHGHTTVEAPPAYTPLPTPTETVAVAGPSRGHGSKIEYASGPVQVTLTPDGLTLVDPLQPSISQASASSSSSKKARREAANDVERPELPQANVSAPELHVPPQREEPVRPTTVPIAAPAPAVAATMSSAPSAGGPSAPPLTKSRSRKPSIATPPKDLDKIDELDESDPLGVAWHMAGPYDAIPRPVRITKPDAHGGDGGRPKIFAAQAGAHGQVAHSSSGGSHGRRKQMAVDPSVTSFAVKPGQLFPLIAQPAYPPPPLAAPAPSQAPFSPTLRQAYVNNHMVPGATAPERPPPLFSPTPSEMARQHSARDLRRQGRERERESVSLNEPNLSGVGTAYASTLSEGHSMSGSSGFASFASAHAAMPRSNEYGQPVPPPMQMQREHHMPHHDHHQYHEEHNVLHRPHPNPLQPGAGIPPEQQLKPQSSRSTLSRARSAPNSAPPSAPPSSAPSTNSSHSHHSSHHSRQQQVLSDDPPPTPDIQLPPPPPPPQSSQSIPPPPGSMRSGAPSMHSSATGRSQMPPSNRYMPRKLVMPTPLQPMQPLPGAPAPAPYAPSARSAGAAQGAPLKHSQTLPARAARPAAQDIPMSQGKNVLRKHKENGAGAGAPERIVRAQSSRANMGAANASSASLGRESRRSAPAPAPGATAVWAGHVVVVPEEKKKGGLGALFGFGGGSAAAKEREREREREREKERVLAERAREKERERARESQREREKRKLSKARR